MSDAEKTRRALRRRVRDEERLLLVVAGPNGVGKSTFVETFLKPTGILVVNPDEVARGLSPDTPEAIAYEAARVADTWRRDLVARGVSFCMETVFSDRHGAKLDFLRECQSQGYAVTLIFIGLESVDLSRGRVMERVEAGGHDVPDEKIDTRCPRTFTNLRQALSFVNQALLFDNSSADEPYRFVAEFRDGKRKRRKGYHPAWAASLDYRKKTGAGDPT
jgi:predicted ABC-type ATPase